MAGLEHKILISKIAETTRLLYLLLGVSQVDINCILIYSSVKCCV